MTSAARVVRVLLAGVCAVVTGSMPAAAADSRADYRVGDRLPQTNPKPVAGGFKEIKWDALLPPDWKPMRALEGLNLGMLNDSDPRATEALERLREEWSKAPANETLNGSRIRIPGFLVPLEMRGSEVSEFLLVPYFGACIHVPPPPANQIIHVFPAKPVKVQTMDAIWVSGQIETTRSNTMMGVAGYRMKAEAIAPYKASDAK